MDQKKTLVGAGRVTEDIFEAAEHHCPAHHYKNIIEQADAP